MMNFDSTRTKRPSPPRSALAPAAALAVALTLSACGSSTAIPPHADVGPQPLLVDAPRVLVPTVNVAKAVPFTANQAPMAAPGLQVTALARDLVHPRWLLVLPNGDVLVAETNAPPRPASGIRGWIMKLMMKRAGAAVPSANRITLLRDTDGDGQAELRTAFLEGLNSPFGMVLVGDKLYVAHTDSIWEYPYRSGETRISAAGRKLADLPAGPINHHWTKNLLASVDGRWLYATVGSNSNIAENGFDAEQGRAAIWVFERATGSGRIFASGLRNPNGMAWEPGTGTLWTVVNERDELGSDLVPDYLTTVQDGAFYGWPFSWYGRHVDVRVQPRQPQLVAAAVVPDYALGSHVAPLGLAYAAAGPVTAALGAGPGMFVGLHGSWNRRPLSGYKVVFVPFADGRPKGLPIEVLGGFLSTDGEARGRPVGVAIDARGGLLVADDVGNAVWRVSGR
jgi:glucose/arabinose dehydrogenase